MYKAIISDLDGTLLNENHDVDEFTINTVKKVLEKGIKFYIATGRSYFGAKEVMDKLNLEIPLITSNGARILNSEGKEIYIKNLEEKYLNKIFAIDYKSIGKDIIINGYSGNDWFVVEDVIDFFINQRPDRLHVPAQIEEKEFKNKKFTKIFFLGDHDKLLELEKIIIESTKNKVITTFASERSLEIFSKECDKSIAAEYLLKKDNLKLEDAVAFGDGLNDYSMLKKAGKGYLMENSLYKLFERLPNNEIVKSNENNGVADKITELFLERE